MHPVGSEALREGRTALRLRTRRYLTRVVMTTRPTVREASSRLGIPQVPEPSQAWGTSDKLVSALRGWKRSCSCLFQKKTLPGSEWDARRWLLGS